MNNDFLVTREVICQWFPLVTSSLVKSLANHLTRDQKSVIHGNSCIILYFLTDIYGHAFAILNTDLGTLSKIATILVFSNFLFYKMKQLPFSISHRFLSSSFKCLKVRFQSENMKSAENTTALHSDISDINQWAPDASCMLGWSAFFRIKQPPKFSSWQIFHRKYFFYLYTSHI